MYRLLGILVVALVAAFATASHSADGLPRAVLYLDESDSVMTNPGYSEIAGTFRTTLRDKASSPITIYAEQLGLTRFRGPQYEAILRNYLHDKYVERPIGLIMAVGSSSLRFALQFRSGPWSDVPIVFAAVDTDTADRILASATNVTGHTLRFSLENAIETARALVPELKQIALVGDRLDDQPFRRHFNVDALFAGEHLKLIDLTGLPMGDIRARVATLPPDAAIVYTAITRDGAGVGYVPYEALAAFADAANRPIVIDIDNRLGRGGTGGPVVQPGLIGKEAAELALRIFNGADASKIAVADAQAVKQIYDWRELQRWGVPEARLPAGSEVRFRAPTMWEQYYWRIIAIMAAFVLQTALVVALLYEDRRRRFAEANGQVLLSELAHLNRAATAGELTASIAHEIRQPLAAIVASGGAGVNWLKQKTPDLDEVRTLLQDIVKQGHRADDVIKNIRAMFRKETTPRLPLDVNESIRQVLRLTARKIELSGTVCDVVLADPPPVVLADPVQLQQVLLNLIGNAVEAMGASAPDARVLRVRTEVDQDDCIITIEDTGPGIDPNQIDQVFKPFFTTKSGGMGLGLSICKTITEAHGGQLSVEPGAQRGALFRIVLPRHGSERA